MWTEQFCGECIIICSGFATGKSSLSDYFPQIFDNDSEVYLPFISEFTTMISKKHSLLFSSLADNCLPSWSEYLRDYSWNCNCLHNYLNCAEDRDKQETHIDPIPMPGGYDMYLQYLQVVNQSNNFRQILVLMLIYVSSALDALKHPLVHDTSPPKQLCWKQRVPCKLNNVTNEKHQSSMSEKTRTKIAVSWGSVNYPACGETILKLEELQ